ncbi:MAG: hypothetical protein JWQ27_2275 [Ferruginibacter sp.]|nr:hypothetical protein [Ferruginibacter sp.]
MKKFFLAACLCVWAIAGFTQNVGVGVASPLYKLHIGNGDLFVNSSQGTISLGYPGADYKWRWTTTNGGQDLLFRTEDPSAVQNTRLYMRQNGNIGVGLPAIVQPSARFEIYGSGSSSGTNTFLVRKNNGDTIMRIQDDGKMSIGYNGPTLGRTLNLEGSGANFYNTGGAFGGAVFATDTSLVLWSTFASNRYVVMQPTFGNVGIGTYSPNSKFHVNGLTVIGNSASVPAAGYQLSVDGKIICEEARVQNSTAWPDYVFGSGYQLTPLEEVEKHIKAFGHLANIPPAAKVEKEGFDLGDMNVKLLEKVEELTLYLIELKKENTALTQRVSALEKKID